jgi:heme oxygenase (biliverdin-producing, ferredoxin)
MRYWRMASLPFKESIMTELSTRLHSGIRQAHSVAENSEFMRKFLLGEINKRTFARLVSRLYPIYSVLETELGDHQDDPGIAAINFPELHRTSELEKDLQFYLGQDWRNQLPPFFAVDRYVSRIREVSASQPILLVAHAYTRYMGDLSGGQMLKQIVRKSLGLEGTEGSAFYEFARIPNCEAFKAQYRQTLDGIDCAEVTVEQLVAEANLAFRLNLGVLQELEQLSSAVC